MTQVCFDCDKTQLLPGAGNAFGAQGSIPTALVTRLSPRLGVVIRYLNSQERSPYRAALKLGIAIGLTATAGSLIAWKMRLPELFDNLSQGFSAWRTGKPMCIPCSQQIPDRFFNWNYFSIFR